ncbi:hypothetical protein KIN20_029279 [Parelaphostrongylus tenuis]|uniref:Uncharacterized protein n=1 Tax=Parelaphostrongylus tenuis TaxID=148309 RepID=A0AAD5R2D7_PARTN|nr:hypothetical protein KIN20_029279 [Parelaphostrongylus tenuis]
MQSYISLETHFIYSLSFTPHPLISESQPHKGSLRKFSRTCLDWLRSLRHRGQAGDPSDHLIH